MVLWTALTRFVGRLLRPYLTKKMNVCPNMKLGHLTRKICSNAPWEGQDDFPWNQAWADEVEEILSFLQTQGQFERYLPRLTGTLTQRDSSLNEARIALVFHRMGFSIKSWEPKGNSNKFLEYEIQWQETKPIFVEVKGPRWEGELDISEIKGGRKQKPRYVSGEARNVDSVGKVIEAAENAYPKFFNNKPNLLVVTIDLLFFPPNRLPRNTVVPQVTSALEKKKLSNIGGILFFDSYPKLNKVEYDLHYIENPLAEHLCAIPKTASKALETEEQIKWP
jgi:hypothetical protein